MPLRAHIVLSIVILSSFLSCSAAAPSNEGDSAPAGAVGDVGQVASPIIDGTASPASQNSVVLIAQRSSPSSSSDSSHEIELCTGTLLAPNLVLTARHCVAPTDDLPIQCNASGQPISGGQVGANYPADELYVFAGQDQSNNFFNANADTIYYDARGLQVLDDGSTNLCNHDIALLVLDTPINNMPISPVRLDTNVEVGEAVTAVGWGITETGNFPVVRQQRTGVGVLVVGPYSNSPGGGGLGPNEFVVGEAACHGDSGGPVLASTGAVVGVASRVGNGISDPNNLAAGCIDTNTNTTIDFYTELASFRSFILNGYSVAGAQPQLEGNATTGSSSSSGCSASAAGHAEPIGFGSAAFAAIALALAARRRRSLSI